MLLIALAIYFYLNNSSNNQSDYSTFQSSSPSREHLFISAIDSLNNSGQQLASLNLTYISLLKEEADQNQLFYLKAHIERLENNFQQLIHQLSNLSTSFNLPNEKRLNKKIAASYAMLLSNYQSLDVLNKNISTIKNNKLSDNSVAELQKMIKERDVKINQLKAQLQNLSSDTGEENASGKIIADLRKKLTYQSNDLRDVIRQQNLLKKRNEQLEKENRNLRNALSSSP